MWRYRELLPLPTDGDPVTLGEGAAPMVEAPAGLENPLDKLYLQNETVNPTFSFKDRFHTVSISMARHLGIEKVVCSTTGNHGMSAAACGPLDLRRCCTVVSADGGSSRGVLTTGLTVRFVGRADAVPVPGHGWVSSLDGSSVGTNRCSPTHTGRVAFQGPPVGSASLERRSGRDHGQRHA